MKKKEEKIPNWLASQELGKKLKEIGFDKRCFFTVLSEGICGAATFKVYHLGLQDTNFTLKSMFGGYNMPFWEDIFQWFREKEFDSYIGLESNSYIDKGVYYYFEILKPKLYGIEQLAVQSGFDNYEEAREQLVYKLIEVYKESKKKANENNI